MAMKVPVSMHDRQKSYFKYYAQDIYKGEKEKYDKVTKEPMDNSLALHIDKRNDLFLPGNLPGEFGWWIMDDGTATIANETFFPGATGEMFDWWFAWHPIDRLRYACWNCEDHFDVYLDHPLRSLDSSLSLREKTWGSVHNIWEDTSGTGRPDRIKIYFNRPSYMGYNESLIDTEACAALITGNGFTIGHDDIPDIPAVMTHFVRPAEGGCVLRSRFWIGWMIEEGHAICCIPESLMIPPEVPRSLLLHNIKEFSNLSKILPSIYEEEKDNWSLG
ncbi:MAG: phloretin hydrolase [Lachnospiraceae bacterium]|nr:phloretin hydrolase [Lachnospiraceae bacterium]